MSDDGESGLTRWSRLKRRAREGTPTEGAPEAPEKTPKRGGAAPVAGRRLVPSLPPLADAEEDDDDPYNAPPVVQAHGLPPATAGTAGAASEDDENHELTPEEQEAVKNLPPIESLSKDSDFTPFLADNVPAFLRRKALKVLWRSDPVIATADDLDDCFGDYSIATLTGKAVTAATEAGRAAKAVGGDEAAEADDAGTRAAVGDKGNEGAVGEDGGDLVADERRRGEGTDAEAAGGDREAGDFRLEKALTLSAAEPAGTAADSAAPRGLPANQGSRTGEGRGFPGIPSSEAGGEGSPAPAANNGAPRQWWRRKPKIPL